MKFTNAIKLGHNGLLQKVPGTKYWIIKEEFYWWIDYHNKKRKVTIPKGFKCDFGSIPRSLRFMFSPTRYISYLLHDYMCSHPKSYTRKEADLILLEALHIEKAFFIERVLIYIGVRIGAFLGIGVRK